jgi:4-hydroxyphenylpyruvate dioxygenase-like putative hemolysin
MLRRVDRVQIAVRDRLQDNALLQALGAVEIGENELKTLGARRFVMQAGTSIFEFLEPDGSGPVADHIARFGAGLFAVGFSTDDLDAAAHTLERAGVRFERERGQLFPDPRNLLGMRTVLSLRHERVPVGMLGSIYEGTFLVADHLVAASHYANAFALDSRSFVPIELAEFGYKGQLLMFEAVHRLDRIELATITDPAKPMGRFFRQRGNSWYMFYAEADDLESIAELLRERGVRFSEHRDLSTLFLHPSAFCGTLVGISRRGAAWRWSGDPVRGGLPGL